MPYFSGILDKSKVKIYCVDSVCVEAKINNSIDIAIKSIENPNIIFTSFVNSLGNNTPTTVIDKWHKHENKYQIIYPSEGIIHLDVKDKGEFKIISNRAVFITKNTYHQANFKGVQKHFNLYLGDELLANRFIKNSFVFNVSPFLRILILRCLEIKTMKSVKENTSHEYYLLNVLIGEMFLHQSLELMLPCFTHSQLKDKRLSKTIEFIAFCEENNQRVLLKEVAIKGGISSKQLNRYFEKKLGMNFSQYILQRKFHKAVQMACEKYTMQEISDALGHSQVSAFARFFKKMAKATFRQYFSND